MNGIGGIFIIVALLVSISAYCLWRYWGEDWKKKGIENFPLVILLAGFHVIVPLLLVLLVGSIVPPSYETEPSSKTSIASLETLSDVEGSFILGTGGIESDLFYYYYEILPDGSYKLDSIPADDAVIKEFKPVSSVSPKIETYNRVTWQVWLIPVLEHDNIYVIYIPEGSVITKYNPMVR